MGVSQGVRHSAWQNSIKLMRHTMEIFVQDKFLLLTAGFIGSNPIRSDHFVNNIRENILENIDYEKGNS